MVDEITLENVYDEDTNFDGMEPLDMVFLAQDLFDQNMPIPTDLIARLHNAGLYIAH